MYVKGVSASRRLPRRLRGGEWCAPLASPLEAADAPARTIDGLDLHGVLLYFESVPIAR
jgi:hypothetical protein